MAKPKQKRASLEEVIKYLKSENVRQMDLTEIVPENMNRHMVNNNSSRHIPSVVDGLKPVARRILYTMFKMGLRPGSKPTKSSQVCSTTMGDYHPHGDTAIFDVMTNLGQWWKIQNTLVDLEGGEGTQYDDKSAANRYLDVTLSKFGWDVFFDDFKLDDVFTIRNYTDSEDMPEYLSTKLPMALVMGPTLGIGNGIQVSNPMYNLNETIQKLFKIIDDPDYNDPLLIPDSPTYCDIIEETPFEELSRTGKGTIQYRGKVYINKEEFKVIITDIPPMVKMDTIRDNIYALIDENKFPRPLSFQPMSELSEHGSATLELRFSKEIDLNEVRKTIMTQVAGVKVIRGINFVLLKDYNAEHYDILKYLREWLDARRDQKMSYYSKRFTQLSTRIHQLKIILKVISGKNAERSLAAISKAENRAEIVSYLMKEFASDNITSLQAESIAKMRFEDKSKGSIAAMKEELKDKEEKVAEIRKIIRTPKLIDYDIREELEKILEKYNTPRKSKVIRIEDDKIVESQHIMVFTHQGNVKKFPAGISTFGEFAEDDFPVKALTVSSTDNILIFDSAGKSHKLPVEAVRSSELNSFGTPLNEHMALRGTIRAIVPQPDNDIKGDFYFLFLTKKGIIKKTYFDEYISRNTALDAIKLDADDELVDVSIIWGSPDIIVYTASGRGVRYNTSEVSATGRVTRGVIGIDMSKDTIDDHVIGFDIVGRGGSKDKFIMCITKKGFAKKCLLSRFATGKRLDKVLRISQLKEGDEMLKMVTIHGDEDFQVYMKGQNTSFKAEEVKELSRMAHPEKLIGVRRGDNIIDVVDENIKI